MAEPLVLVEEAELRAGVWSFPPGDHPHLLGPTIEFDQAGEFENPCARPGGAVRLDCGFPILFLGQEQGVSDALVDGESDREPDTAFDAAVDERMRRASRVGPHQHRCLRRSDGQLGERPVQDGEVIRSVVRPGVARPQQSRQRFAGLIHERDERIEPEPVLVGRRSVVLLGMRVDERPIDVDHDRLGCATRGPHACSGLGPRGSADHQRG